MVTEVTHQGQMHVTIGEQRNFAAAHDRYTMLRGGSNAMVAGSTVIGLGLLRAVETIIAGSVGGARSVDADEHLLRVGLRAMGFNIVDPTSLFMFGDRLHLGPCCSEREWFYGQRFLNLLVAVRTLVHCPDRVTRKVSR